MPVPCTRELHPALQAFFRKLNQSGGLNHATLLKEFAETDTGMKVKIRNGEVCEEFRVGDGWETWKEDITWRWQNLYKSVFQEVASRTDLPDMDVILSLLDGAPGGAGVLKVEGTIGEDFLAVPRSVGDFDIPSWASYYNEQKQKCKNRTNKFVFRGGITGAVYSMPMFEMATSARGDTKSYRRRDLI
jgi:hypothetical protein